MQITYSRGLLGLGGWRTIGKLRVSIDWCCRLNINRMKSHLLDQESVLLTEGPTTSCPPQPLCQVLHLNFGVH